MPLPRPILTIPYKNDTEERIPPYAVLKFTDNVESTDTYISVIVTKPDGEGEHFALDSGKGAMESEAGDSKYCYGECVKGINGLFWAHYTDSEPPATAWESQVGPVEGEWFVDSTGSGFVYAGQHDVDNECILVMQLLGGATSTAQGRLLTPLTPADNGLTSPTTFQFVRWLRNRDIDPPTIPQSLMEEVDADDAIIETDGVNRSHLEANADGYVICVKINGEWNPVLITDPCRSTAP